jgi:hypothetical protein
MQIGIDSFAANSPDPITGVLVDPAQRRAVTGPGQAARVSRGREFQRVEAGYIVGEWQIRGFNGSSGSL